MSQSLTRSTKWKTTTLAWAGMLAACLSASVSQAQNKDKPVVDKAEELGAPQVKKNNLLVSGYTRPGWPNDTIKDGKVISVAWDDTHKGRVLGGTVYFAVYERNSTGLQGDTFATGMANIDQMFSEGRGQSGGFSPAFDVNSKYLYVYQIVNDRGLDGYNKVVPAGAQALRCEDIVTTTVKLIVDPKEITSWGYFESLGFASKLPDREFNEGVIGDPNGKILPVAYSANPALLAALPRTEYTNMAPAVSLRKLSSSLIIDKSNLNLQNSVAMKGLTTKLAKNPAALPVSNNINAVVKNGGKEPSYVQIVPAGMEQYGNLVTGMEPPVLQGEQPPPAKNVARAYLKVDWRGENIVKLGQHSVMFGFTTNLPPTEEPCRIVAPNENKEGGKEGAPGQAELVRHESAVKADEGTGIHMVALQGGASGQVSAVGNVPSPTPAAAAEGFAADGFGSWMGGMSGGGGTGGGMGGIGAGSIGAARAPAFGGGGGFGGGTSGSNQGQQPATTTGTKTDGTQGQVINFSPILVNQQAQLQAQAQAQAQQQSQTSGCCCDTPGEVVPEPAAIALGLLGVPALFVVWRNRRNKKLIEAQA